MFPPMEFEGANYYLKAMNCPMHNLIFRSRGRSYRELPLRLFEFGSVYRYEKSGVVHGLTRVRGLTQDDSHSYVTPEQAPAEIKHLLDFVLGLLRDFGLDDFYLELSTRDDSKPDKFVGSDEDWATATKVLEDVAIESGLELVPDPGGAAFYGPKISVQARDAIGRTWQMSTIQYDFNQPTRLRAGVPGRRRHPAAAGDDPLGQVRLDRAVLRRARRALRRRLPAVARARAGAGDPGRRARTATTCTTSRSRCRPSGLRVEVDDSDDRMQKKIRNAQLQKVPFMMIAGDDDVAAGAVSFRYRDGRQDNGVPDRRRRSSGSPTPWPVARAGLIPVLRRVAALGVVGLLLAAGSALLGRWRSEPGARAPGAEPAPDLGRGADPGRRGGAAPGARPAGRGGGGRAAAAAHARAAHRRGARRRRQLAAVPARAWASPSAARSACRCRCPRRSTSCWG